MERSTGYAILDDLRIAYEIVGDGPVDFILNTGWISPFDVEWDDPHARAFFQQFGRFARLIRFDRRGVGASDPSPSVMEVLHVLTDNASVVVHTRKLIDPPISAHMR